MFGAFECSNLHHCTRMWLSSLRISMYANPMKAQPGSESTVLMSQEYGACTVHLRQPCTEYEQHLTPFGERCATYNSSNLPIACIQPLDCCPQDLDVRGLRAVNKQLQSQAFFVLGFGKIAGRVFSVITRPQFCFGRWIFNLMRPDQGEISRIVTRHV